MAKRSGNRTSRQKRKQARERSERAREHGLPEGEEPSVKRPEPQGKGSEHDSATAEGSTSAGLPVVTKVAIALVIGLLILWVLSFLRKG